jgi:hypothetical protein
LHPVGVGKHIETGAGEKRLENRATTLRERTHELARAFLEEVRHDLTVAGQRYDLPPRIRTMHTRPGHATPEYRTLAIPKLPPGVDSTALLSVAIAHYARAKPTCSIVLAFDALVQGEDGEPCPVLMAEARDRWGTRLYLSQPFGFEGGRLIWGEPAEGGWRDPGEEEMILDAAFEVEGEEGRPAAEMSPPPVPAAE